MYILLYIIHESLCVCVYVCHAFYTLSVQKIHMLIKIQVHISILSLQKFFQKNFRGPEVTSSGGYNANRNYKFHRRKLCNSSKWPLKQYKQKSKLPLSSKTPSSWCKRQKRWIICPEGANVTIFQYSPEGAQHKKIRQSNLHNKNKLMREAPEGLNFKVMTMFLPEGQLSWTY